MWECPKCGEAVEAAFEVCWNCGTSQDGVQDPEFGRVCESEPNLAERGPPQFGVGSLLALTTGIAILLAVACNNALWFLAPVFFVALILVLLHVGIWALYAFAYVLARKPALKTLVAPAVLLGFIHVLICLIYLQTWLDLPSGARPAWLTAVGYVLLFPLSLLLALNVRPPSFWELSALAVNSCVWGLGLAWLMRLIATRAHKLASAREQHAKR